jgi:uncharacterized protein (TIGR00725 family)
MGPGEDIDRQTLEAARILGRLIAEQGWVLLSGGRDSGVMKAVNEGAKQVPGSLTVGILPSLETRPSPYIDILIMTDMGNARNNINVLSSDIVVAVGQGGTGTASEVALALKAGKKVILLDADPLTRSFFQALKKKLVLVAQTPFQVISLIKTFKTDIE